LGFFKGRAALLEEDEVTLSLQHHIVEARRVLADRLFAEKISGAQRDRPALERCLGSLEPGDAVVVTKLDRLARSTRDLLNVLALIADYGASFRSLGDPWADTTTPHGKLMITVLGGLAEFERHLIVKLLRGAIALRLGE
jgi:DNA invertase Pin-like site-specific DNA recombinase